MGGVGRNLHRRAAGPEHHQRPDGRVLARAYDQLVRVRARDHRLDSEAANDGGGPQPLDAGQDFFRSNASLGRRRQRQSNAADVRLVRDVVGQHLDDAGRMLAQHLPCLRFHVGGVGGDVRGDDGDAVARQQRLRLDLGQRGAPGRERVVQYSIAPLPRRSAWPRWPKAAPASAHLGRGGSARVASGLRPPPRVFRTSGCARRRTSGGWPSPRRRRASW